MRSKIGKFARDFWNDARGSVSVETVIILPMLLWSATATYVFFDVYKVENTTYRANYTISDMLSRKKEAIDQDYIDGLYTVFKYMTGTTDANSNMQFSVVQCLADCSSEADRALQLKWSHGVNGSIDLEAEDLPYVAQYLPLFSAGDELILVQTFTDYVPPFSKNLTGFGAREMRTDIVTRPRFGPQLKWATAGGGGTDDPDIPDGN